MTEIQKNQKKNMPRTRVLPNLSNLLAISCLCRLLCDYLVFAPVLNCGFRRDAALTPAHVEFSKKGGPEAPGGVGLLSK